MSATNRSSVRRPYDLYETPEECTQSIIPYLGYPRSILEPAAGSGAIIRVLKRHLPEFTYRAIDINIFPPLITTSQDFLTLEPDPSFDLVLGNPPYSLAEEFCKRSMLWRKDVSSRVCMLLRLNFLESQKRAVWLRENTPSVYVLPKRPSFTGKGTDATGYGWFMWDNTHPTIKILEIPR